MLTVHACLSLCQLLEGSTQGESRVESNTYLLPSSPKQNPGSPFRPSGTSQLEEVLSILKRHLVWRSLQLFLLGCWPTLPEALHLHYFSCPVLFPPYISSICSVRSRYLKEKLQKNNNKKTNKQTKKLLLEGFDHFDSWKSQMFIYFLIWFERERERKKKSIISFER